MGYLGRKLSDVAHYLPKQTSEVLTQDRSFAFVHLQSPGMKTTIAMNVYVPFGYIRHTRLSAPLIAFRLNKTLKLFVAGYDGVVCVYEVNTIDGGECKQISQYLLFSMSPNSNTSQATASSPIGQSCACVFRSWATFASRWTDTSLSDESNKQ